jgi:dephospho-CoA kinase
MHSEQEAHGLTKPVVGLIGGIGSGKSVVASMLAEMGGHVIDADRLGHEALRQPDIAAQVVQRWGERVLDESGQIQRRRLASIVFADVAERKALENAVFPWIERRIHEELIKAEQDPHLSFTVLDAAILLETGWGENCNHLLFIKAPREERLRRLAANRGWSAKEVEAREQAQMSLEEKAARAQAVIENNGNLAQTRSQVEKFVATLRRDSPD